LAGLPVQRRPDPVTHGQGRFGRRDLGAEECPRQALAGELLFADISNTLGPSAHADPSAVAHSTMAAFAMRLPLETVGAPQPVARPAVDEPGFARGVVIAVGAYERAVRD
jgi:hypothetical protein